MAVKGQQVTSDLPRTIKASGSGPGGKRRGPDRDAELSSSPAAAKRRHRAGVLQSDDAAVRVSGEGEEEGEDLESEEDLDDGGAGISETQGSVRTMEGAAAAVGAVGPQERQRQQLHQSRTHTISLSEIMNLEKTAKLLIPFADFLCLVKEISERQSRKLSRWTPKALLFLHGVNA